MATPRTSTPPKSPNAGTNPFARRRYGTLERITDRVYIVRNITNSSFVIGDRSVAVIDTQVNAPSATELLRLVRSVTSKPIEFVINTHYHWDHTNGNAIFKKEGAVVVSSALTKDFMVSRAARQKEFLSGRGFELGEDPYLPDHTFEGETQIDLGGMPLRLFFAGKAESDDATAIHVLKENVLMSGDTVMTGSFPIFGQPVWDEGLQGDGQWEAAIRLLMGLKPDHVIPGHGPLAHEEEMRSLLKIQAYFVEEVKKRVSAGMSLEAILSEMGTAMPDWIQEMPVVWGTPRYAILRVYRGLTARPTDAEKGWQGSKPSAILKPRGEMKLPVEGSWEEYRQLASEAMEGGDTGLQIRILQNATNRFPDAPDVYAAYAAALMEASRTEASVLEKGDYFQEARTAWEKALALDPNHLPTLLGKGRYLTMMAFRGGDDPSRGMRVLRQALERSTDDRSRAEADFYLGIGYRRLSDETSAAEQFAKALRLDPSFMPARLAGAAV